MEHVEQATAAPGERRQLPIASDTWFTREIAESLGLLPEFEQGITAVTLEFRLGQRVTVTKLTRRG